MKKIAILLLLFLQLGSSQAQSYDNHPWCPPGAQWVYDVSAIGGYFNNLWQYTGDTIIQNESLKIISLTVRFYVMPGQYVEYPPRKFYYAYRQDSVFLWEDNRLKLQYAFNTAPNQTWIVEGDTVSCAPNIPLHDTFVVSHWDTIQMSGVLYTQLNVLPSAHWQFGYNSTTGNMQFIRNIGSPFEFRILPSAQYPHCGGGRVPNLVCYYDSLRGRVGGSGSASGDCMGIFTGTTQLPTTNSAVHNIQLYPNPSQGTAWLNGENMSRAYIFNALGQLVQELSIDQTPFQWSTQNLQPGLYTVWVVLNNNQSVALKLIKS